MENRPKWGMTETLKGTPVNPFFFFTLSFLVVTHARSVVVIRRIIREKNGEAELGTLTSNSNRIFLVF